MKIQIRNTSTSDIILYRQCVENEEFKYNLFGNNLNLDAYTSIKEPHKKFVVSKIDNMKIEDFCFCHFFYQEQEEYFISGGILPIFFNSGIGLYACVAVLSHMFTINHEIKINTTVYKYNQRSLRMLHAIGFQLFREEENLNVLKLTNYQFDNQFVNKIRKRIELFIMN